MIVYFVNAAGLGLVFELLDKEVDAKIVLVGDGVYADLPDCADGVEFFAIEDEARRRGIISRINPKVRLIDYAELVDLITEHRVVTLT